MSYAQRLHDAIVAKKTPALIGLDPRFESLPAPVIESAKQQVATDDLAMQAKAFELFCCELIDVVAPLVPAVKPQAAFFEELGPHGCIALGQVIAYARRKGLIVICDAKRGDIGSTATAYAKAYLAGAETQNAPWGADALTINPYLGIDTLMPFVEVAKQREAGLYVLVRTSNPGAGDFQDRQTEGQTLFTAVGQAVEQLNVEHFSTGNYGSVGAVIGATYPEELSTLRQQMPRTPLLIPGYGAQGGGAQDVASAFDATGQGAVINSSRGINFAFSKSPYKEQFSESQWQQAAQAATETMIADLASVCSV